MIVLGQDTGVYCDDALRKADTPPTRFTVFVNYVFGSGDDDFETEEIDVDAATPGHAREIAQAALRRDYEPGGRIVHVEELQGVLIYAGVTL